MRWNILLSAVMLATTPLLTITRQAGAEPLPSLVDNPVGPPSPGDILDFLNTDITQRLPSLEENANRATGTIGSQPEAVKSIQPSRTACTCEDCEPSRLWIQADYLMWWTRGYHVPPLVTSSPVGTPRQELGVLGAPGTSTLLGDSDYHGALRSGVRLQVGTWFDEPYPFGVEGDWIRLQDSSTTLLFESDDNQFLARPINNILIGQADAQYLPVGNIGVRSTSAFSSAGVSLFKRWCVSDPCNGDGCNPCDRRWTLVKLTGGYRYHSLGEGISLNEFVSSGDPFVPASMRLNDSFSTRNEFHGGEIGIAHERHFGRWSTELSAKIGLGNTRQHASIHGNTVTTVPAGTYDYDAGFLALRSNSGDYSRNRLSMIAEIGCRAGLDVTDHLRLSVGYTFLYWGNTVRPGDQIDTTLNPELFPPEVSPLTGPLRPAFAWHESDFWAQGIDFALEMRW